MKKPGLILFLLALLASPAFADEQYHEAQTQPEKALDRIFQRDNEDADLIDYVIGFPGRETGYDLEFGHMVTPALVEDASRQERALVKMTCNGHYRDAEVCDFDFDILTCTQDNGDSLYETKEETASTALVYAVFRDFTSEHGPRQYHLVKQDGEWLLDGVACPLGSRFNW